MSVRTSATARFVVMGLLMVGMLIPLQMVQSIVTERAARRESAVQDIGGTWGRAQTIGGAILTVPYRYTAIDRDGKAQQYIGRASFLPETLDVKGAIEPLLLQRGLFKVVVYKAHLNVTGRFTRPDFSTIKPAPATPIWDEATVSIGIADPRGVVRRVTLNWMGREVAPTPGVEDNGLVTSGLHASIAGLDLLTERTAMPFTYELDLNGSRDLKLLPTGSDTSVQLTSSWPHPSFTGAPLPVFRETSATGFTGRWSVPYFGRGYPPQWTSVTMDRAQLKTQVDASAFGVSLVQPVDIYQQAERAVKYAALFIVMTFVVFFLWETLRSRLLHPIQYSFVGFAMCVFYLLLVSLSEHVGFDWAYSLAAVSTTLLISGYSRNVLGGAAEGALMGCGLAGLYGFLYLLLRLEDYALLAGSVGLFAMLAFLMYATRHLNWYELRLGESPQQ
jgi:inner membrane protein